jgi:hypothetical protein
MSLCFDFLNVYVVILPCLPCRPVVRLKSHHAGDMQALCKLVEIEMNGNHVVTSNVPSSSPFVQLNDGHVWIQEKRQSTAG